MTYDNARIIINDVLEGLKLENSLKNVDVYLDFDKNLYVLALGKAAWDMAYYFSKNLNDIKIKKGLIITKKNHSKGGIKGFDILESSHPILDQSSIIAGKKAIEFVSSLGKNDQLVMLISGGGSALMEVLEDGLTLEEFQLISKQFFEKGLDIVEINTIRKELSAVKGGKLANMCPDTKITNIIVSDVLGNKLDFIASGPTVQNTTNSDDAIKIINKYGINVDKKIKKILSSNKKIVVNNSNSYIISDINKLCDLAKNSSEKLGYMTYILTRDMSCEAKDAGSLIGGIAKELSSKQEKIALIFAGETVVNLDGDGIGGRNQELVLSSCREIGGYDNVVIFSVGTDGTDGPTDAAGGIVDGYTMEAFKNSEIDVNKSLKNHDSYKALKSIGGLIFTGPTGTNVNDLTMILIN